MITEQHTAAPPTADPLHFRRVLGNYPTGVCIVTALDPERGPIGMTVGSFASVSLDPPLVSFMPMRNSGTFERIRSLGRFCVNVLSAGQAETCRRFARHDGERFADLAWHPAPSGAPVIDGSLAWIDCTLTDVHPAGDHYIAVGAVDGLDADGGGGVPLLFFQGGYGRFSNLTLTAGGEDVLAGNLLLADLARPHIEELSRRFGVECHATGRAGGNLIQLAFSGPSAHVTKVGLRLPFLPPMGAGFVAWADPPAVERWMAGGEHQAGTDGTASSRAALARMLAGIRERGWLAVPADERRQVVEGIVDRLAAHGPLPAAERELTQLLGGLPHSHPVEADPLAGPLHSLTVPVFGPDGQVALLLTLNSLDGQDSAGHPCRLAGLRRAAAAITAAIGGTVPASRQQNLHHH
ncbi:flavin reductase [Arthrobacter sp. I2-34]|uniref:Flavin reductase n=1 Tax=Arthrobacter hankyongi TaxID=2904801 RepID=A0ABS9L8W7_9MICC|nr:flavin reductase [Arthrobacter hankyongi]MCG2623046.1 flavin reductase [Arthrobacter hankyongi]